MGKAVVDLPDPLNPPPATSASTDDLLAQLAGDEIDRMLAKADFEAPPGAPIQAAAIPVAPQTDATSATDTPPAAPPVGSTDAQLDALLGELSARSAKPAPPVAEPPAAPTDLEDELDSAAERGALKDAADLPMVETATAPAGLAADPNGSILLRLLAWVNAPLASSSDSVRDLIGKIAILTTVNAIAVLVYVLLFRHHG